MIVPDNKAVLVLTGPLVPKRDLHREQSSFPYSTQHIAHTLIPARRWLVL
jgi:hypothetical protein